MLYTDGSFRQGLAGWGVHGYTYTNTPMKSKAATKQQPTASGYQDVGAEDTCTVIEYIDSFGKVVDNPTNNTAELSAAINGFKIADASKATKLTMLMDSEYVRKGLESYLPKWIKNNWVK
ncbi:ribonuclease HI, partial [Pseudomonas aeruginosa]|uniref:ribonuclease HI n=1 Tax=Pseudomonas aeruginosa TaxID=287 RepID=UPI0027E3F2E0